MKKTPAIIREIEAQKKAPLTQRLEGFVVIRLGRKITSIPLIKKHVLNYEFMDGVLARYAKIDGQWQEVFKKEAAK